MPDTYLLPIEAAAYLRVAPKTLTKWRGQGKGPPYRKVAGSLIRYVQRELEAWMDTQGVFHNDVDEPQPQPPTPLSKVHALPPRRRGSRAPH